jgi:hypothetical protein
MSFLSKAAIGAGLAIGGLALTGAVVNAGRSSEPYQEPARSKPVSQPSNTTRNAAIGLAATSLAGAAIAKNVGQQANNEIDKVVPIVNEAESTPATKPQATKTRNPEEQAAYESEQPRIQALKELASVNYPAQKRGYELALAAELKRKQLLPEEIEKKKQNLELGDDEGYVRIDDVKARAGNGIVNKAAREKQSADLQRLYDKLKEHGLEDSIQFRGAVNKKDGTPLAESANQYSINLGGDKGTVRVGEMRFIRNQDKIQEAIAENIKNPQGKSQPPEKSAKPPKPKVEPEASVTAKPSTGQETVRPKRTFVDDLSAKLSRDISEDGFVAQSGLIGELRKKPQYKNTDLDQEIEDLAQNSGGRIQLVTDKYGKTLVRDLDQVKTFKLVSEAKKLTDPNSDRKRLLDDAATYKEAKATSEDEKAGVAELKAAIAGIKEVKPEQRVSKDKTPVADKEKKGQRGLGADKPASLEDAEKLGLAPKGAPAPVTSAISDLDAATATANLEADREKTKKKLSRAETGVPTRDQETYISPKKQFEADVKTLKTQLEEEEIAPDKLSKRVEELRQHKTAQDTLKVDTTLSRLEEDYELEIGAKEDEISRARDKTSAKTKKKELAQIISDKNKAVEARTLEVYRSLGIPDLAEDAPKVAPKKESPVPEPVTTPVTPAPKAISEANAVATALPTQNPQREEAAKLTVARMREILKAQGITVPKNAKKDQLLDLLVPNSKPEKVNDAIAPSESYLAAYQEIRDKYRRAS